jgi:hypothetical protein
MLDEADDHSRCRQGTMDDAVEASAQRIRDRFRRPIPGSRTLVMKRPESPLAK